MHGASVQCLALFNAALHTVIIVLIPLGPSYCCVGHVCKSTSAYLPYIRIRISVVLSYIMRIYPGIRDGAYSCISGAGVH